MGTRKTREQLDAEMDGQPESSPPPPDAPAVVPVAEPAGSEVPVPPGTSTAPEANAPAGMPEAADGPSGPPPVATDPVEQPTVARVTESLVEPPESMVAQAAGGEAAGAAAQESPGRDADPALVPRLKMILESLFFAAGDPLPLPQVLGIARELQPDLSSRGLRQVVDALRLELRDQGRGVRLVEVAGGVQLRTPSETAPYVRMLVSRRPPRMTRPTLETLAILAYRQPITRVEVEDIRGVDSGAVLKHLLERRLVKIIGRKEEPGRPLLYGTTKEFLTLFSLKDLKSLPTLRDFVELSNEHRAALGLPPMEKGESQADEGAPPGEDFLRPDDTTAYTPVGDDEFVQELAEALDELRKRDKRLREWLPLPKEKEEEQPAAPAEPPAIPQSEAAPPADPSKPEEGQPGDSPDPGSTGGGEGQEG